MNTFVQLFARTNLRFLRRDFRSSCAFCASWCANSEAKFLHWGPSKILPIEICGQGFASCNEMLADIFVTLYSHTVTASLMTCNWRLVRKGWMIRKVNVGPFTQFCNMHWIFDVIRVFVIIAHFHRYAAIFKEKKRHKIGSVAFSHQKKELVSRALRPGSSTTVLITMSDTSTFFNAGWHKLLTRCTQSQSHCGAMKVKAWILIPVEYEK